MTAIPDDEKPSPGMTLESVARLIGPSIGLAGTLVVIGYIADSARESLLGVELRSSTSTADYTLTGARFFIDMLDLVEKHFGFTILVVAGVTVASFAFGWLLRLTRDLRLKHGWRHTVMKVVVAIVLLAKWSAIDLPFAHFERVLALARGGNPDFTRLSALVQADAATFWPQFRTAHASDERLRGPALAFIERIFLADIAATVAIAAITVAILRRQPLILTKRRDASAVALAVNWALLLLMIFNAAAVPYVYGKVIQSTTFPQVEVTFDDLTDASLKTFGTADLLVSGDPFILYRRFDGRVWLVRAAKVKSLRIIGGEDVLQVHFFGPQ